MLTVALSRRAWLAAALGGPAFVRAQSPAPARRLVAVGGAITETVYALGAQGELVGVDTTSIFPPEAQQLTSVGYARALSAEGVLSLKPTLLLAGAEAGPPVVLRQLEAARLPIAVLDAGYRIEGVLERTKKLAERIGRREAGLALATRIERDWAATQARVAELIGSAAARGSRPAPRVLFVLAHGQGQARIGGHNTAADAVIRYAGGVNAFGEVEGFKPIAPEAAIAAAPDVILTTDQGLAANGGIDGLLQAPGLASTPAGRARRVVALDAVWMLGFGPRTPQAIAALAEKLHGVPRA